jgi:hypothetical protein
MLWKDVKDVLVKQTHPDLAGNPANIVWCVRDTLIDLKLEHGSDTA